MAAGLSFRKSSGAGIPCEAANSNACRDAARRRCQARGEFGEEGSACHRRSRLDCQRNDPGLGEDGDLAFWSFCEGVQDAAAWIEMPKDELLFRDRKMAEPVHPLREGASG